MKVSRSRGFPRPFTWMTTRLWLTHTAVLSRFYAAKKRYVYLVGEEFRVPNYSGTTTRRVFRAGRGYQAVVATLKGGLLSLQDCGFQFSGRDAHTGTRQLQE